MRSFRSRRYLNSSEKWPGHATYRTDLIFSFELFEEQNKTALQEYNRECDTCRARRDVPLRYIRQTCIANFGLQSQLLLQHDKVATITSSRASIVRYFSSMFNFESITPTYRYLNRSDNFQPRRFMEITSLLKIQTVYRSIKLNSGNLYMACNIALKSVYY